jgi:ferrous iron transport protein A
MTLEELRPGESGMMEKVTAKGMLAQRLMDMGLYPGVEIKVIRNAPLEDPVHVEADGSSVSIRHEEARFVQVRPTARASSGKSEGRG